MKIYYFILINTFLVADLLVIKSACASLNPYSNAASSFYIDYDNDTFVKDGKPFRYISGSIHPYRVPKELWADRLNKMWAAGLNAIQTYIFWNEHEPRPGVYDFQGQNDVFSFIKLAQQIGFVVILRPGPYVCAEHEYGGLPWWLLSNGTANVYPRSSEINYMNAVKRWFGQFLPKIVPYLYKNGGPIITVQVENEYGFYKACDQNYTIALRDMFKKFLGDDVVLFTTDPYTKLTCGAIPGVYTTVDFGLYLDPNVPFSEQRKYNNGKGPLVNSEYYPGWLDFWGYPHETRNTTDVVAYFDQILALNANINFYMFHGGTNFGFSSGAHPDHTFTVQPTSYDYDAPISEAGDTTSKYLAIRDAISKYLPVPQVPIPANSSKIAYGVVDMHYIGQAYYLIIENAKTKVQSQYPLSFEQLGQGYGIVMYAVELDDPNVDGKILHIAGIRDRGYVQIGDNFLGVLYRLNQTDLTINLKNNNQTTLYIIVENMGRYAFGNNLLDSKGIVSNVMLDGKVLTGWTQYLTNSWIPDFQEFTSRKTFGSAYAGQSSSRKQNNVTYGTGFYFGYFDSRGPNYDTFLKTDKFTKGMAFIHNSNNLLTNIGRYWPKEGPQVTLYTPGSFMTPNTNTIFLLELEGTTCYVDETCTVEFVDQPTIDGPTVNV